MEKVTKNRFPTTDDSDDDAGSPMKFGEGSGGHQASAWVPFKLWQRGVEVPTLVSENPAAVELCLAILAGSLVDYPEIFVSEAVAVQIYLLRQRVPSLQTRPEWTTVFIILASLARRRLASDTRGPRSRRDNPISIIFKILETSTRYQEEPGTGTRQLK